MYNSNGKLITISLGFVSVFLIKGEGAVLIDVGPQGSEEKIIKKLNESGVKPDEIKLILLTHAHTDHFGSAQALRKITGAKIAIHQSDAENLRKGINGEFTPTGLFGKITGLFSKREKSIGIIEPDITFNEEFNLEEYGVKGQVLLTPGHTPGSISVMLDNNEVIVGDLMMGLMLRNKPNYPIVADDMTQLHESIKKIVKTNSKKIHTSHGKAFEKEAVINTFKKIDFS